MLELARKMEPGIGERFMLFVRDREQKQRQGAGGSDGSYDLLSYVEFQARTSGSMWCICLDQNNTPAWLWQQSLLHIKLYMSAP